MNLSGMRVRIFPISWLRRINMVRLVTDIMRAATPVTLNIIHRLDTMATEHRPVRRIAIVAVKAAVAAAAVIIWVPRVRTTARRCRQTGTIRISQITVVIVVQRLRRIDVNAVRSSICSNRIRIMCATTTRFVARPTNRNAPSRLCNISAATPYRHTNRQTSIACRASICRRPPIIRAICGRGPRSCRTIGIRCRRRQRHRRNVTLTMR